MPYITIFFCLLFHVNGVFFNKCMGSTKAKKGLQAQQLAKELYHKTKASLAYPNHRHRSKGLLHMWLPISVHISTVSRAPWASWASPNSTSSPKGLPRHLLHGLMQGHRHPSKGKHELHNHHHIDQGLYHPRDPSKCVGHLHIINKAIQGPSKCVGSISMSRATGHDSHHQHISI